MCLRINSCFGAPPADEAHFHAPPNKHGASRTTQRNGAHYNSNGHGHGDGYPARTAASRAEAGRKATNDVRSGPVHAGAQEKAAAAAYPYAGADGTLKQQQQQQPAASNGRPAAAAADEGHGARGGAPHSYGHYERAQPPHAHRDRGDAADSYYYPPAAATADHERV